MRDDSRVRDEEAALYDTELLAEHQTNRSSMHYQNLAALEDTKMFIENTYGPKYAAKFDRLTRPHYRNNKSNLTP